MPKSKGPLEKTGVHIKEDLGQEFKKNIEAAKAILDNLASSPPPGDPDDPFFHSELTK